MTNDNTHDSVESATNDSRIIDDVSRRDVLKAAGASALTAGFASSIVGSVSADDIPTPWLERDGNLLRDPDGNQVILRGVNMADPARLARSWRSKDSMGVFDKATNTDESNDGGWHNNILRVPTQPQDIGDAGSGSIGSMPHGDDWGPLLPGQIDESDMETYFSNYVDPIVDAAEEEGLYVMIDYHRHFPIFHQPQHEEDLGDYQCGNESFENDIGFCGERGVLWHSEEQASQLDGYTEEYAAELNQELQMYWNFVAPRYNDRSHVVYDIYNEPTGPYAGDWGSPTELPATGEEGEGNPSYDADANQEYWDMWVDRAQPWVDTVREHAPDNLITIGSPRWSQLTYWAPTNEFDGENICYTGHVYTHEGMRPLSDSFGTAAEEVPMFFSEFGWAEGGGRDGFSFLEGTTSEYADGFESFLDEYPVHPICWNFDHTWEPSFFVHDESQDGDWVIHDYEARPAQWWQEYLYENRNNDLPESGGDDDDTTAPSIPSNLTVTDETSSSITIQWSASTDSGTSGLAQYNVLVDGSLEQTVSAGTTSATIDGLAADTSYQIAVSAEDGAGNTSGTTTITADTDAGSDDGDTQAPSAPSNVSVESTTETSVEVSWSASTDSGGSGLDSYVVFVDGSQDQTVPAGTTSATVDGLSAGTSYQIGVSAVDGAGNESAATTVGATTSESDDDDDGTTGDLIASIDPGTTSASTGDLVQFWISDETGNQTWITGLEWELGNGTTGRGWYTDERYQSPGTYTVTLTATNNEGETSTDEVEVTIS
ncbi:fibronectin type III domain-containing protein [Halorhabdus sp. BNX81]|uniref:fibronectin type III domain-containing protein n=1 Tax=Halorhabdus sp. BNX81 TaxID=2980181 RepID=UPI0023DD0E88|nr:fibronectin type III domain-containing protein [Halorhabdus sp. BNX81]WEL22214.1 Cellulase, glycosyl hydrolase family 5 [Halorhabdus sp. BNX81]